MVAPHSFSEDGALLAAKRAARVAALARRAMADPALASLVCSLLSRALPPHGSVAGVWPLPGEPDLRPLLHDLHRTGRVVLLPETPPRGQPLRFRRWIPGTAMLPGRYGTCHPDGPVATPDLLLVPLLAFDAQGGRLGYGGGYYDRTLAALTRVAAIGFGFACQEVASVPVGPHDVRLALVATELGSRHLGPPRPAA